MGGNALKEGLTERKSAKDYSLISTKVCDALNRLFPNTVAHPILAFRTKESFGDADILIESDNLPANWHDLVKEEFKPQEVYANGGVLSFDYERMQIDLITSPISEYVFAFTYFSFNDLGNLMGRIAHKMGFKYGHDGLWCLLRDEKNQKIADILVTMDTVAAFKFMGYDYIRFLKGFETLENVFEFAASTPYFSRAIYQLDNRNHVSRVRDAKRPSYTAFLKWLEEKPGLDKYTWSSYTGDVVTAERIAERLYWRQKAFDVFPGFKEKVEEAYKRHDLIQRVKKVWNGDVVREITGYTGKQLGAFMSYCKDSWPTSDPSYPSFEEWVVSTRNWDVIQYVEHCRNDFEKQEKK